MAHDDGKAAVGRRSSRLLKVLVAGGVALAAGCAGMHSKSSTGSSSSDAADNGKSQPDSSKGGGASGW